MVDLSEQCELVDNILTDRILNNVSSEPEHPAKSDKPLTHIGQDKPLSFGPVAGCVSPILSQRGIRCLATFNITSTVLDRKSEISAII